MTTLLFEPDYECNNNAFFGGDCDWNNHIGLIVACIGGIVAVIIFIIGLLAASRRSSTPSPSQAGNPILAYAPQDQAAQPPAYQQYSFNQGMGPQNQTQGVGAGYGRPNPNPAYANHLPAWNH